MLFLAAVEELKQRVASKWGGQQINLINKINKTKCRRIMKQMDF